jgi:AcrR family transcriptional regulator
MARDAEDTKRRLLDAAALEFAERGVAGARIDRIAAAARANKALIYAYFGNKEQLFDAVFRALVVDTVHDVPVDADDLPGYAGRLFDRNLSHPLAARLALWHSLERGGLSSLPGGHEQHDRDKAAAIAAAQAAGTVGTRFPPSELITMITVLSLLGMPELSMMPPGDPAALARRRRTVVDAVRVLVEAQEGDGA